MQEKKQIRQHFRCLRRVLSSAEQDAAAIAFSELLTEHHLFLNNHSFACYLSHDGELNLIPFIEMLWRQGKRCYLPVIAEDVTLKFALYESDTALIKNKFGIYEPESRHCISPVEIDVVLTPLVAFDHTGKRLGVGMGYYDRTFSFKKGVDKQAPIIVGVAHTCQEHDKLPADQWDVSLEYIATDQVIKQLTGENA